ncbi:hypothetical protein [Streptomyces phaeochromogenes]
MCGQFSTESVVLSLLGTFAGVGIEAHGWLF